MFNGCLQVIRDMNAAREGNREVEQYNTRKCTLSGVASAQATAWFRRPQMMLNAVRPELSRLSFATTRRVGMCSVRGGVRGVRQRGSERRGV